jgi:hypothetical protein
LTRKEIYFHEHAEEKMIRRGISKQLALETLKTPENVVEGKYGRKIAQKVFRDIFSESYLKSTKILCL